MHNIFRLRRGLRLSLFICWILFSRYSLDAVVLAEARVPRHEWFNWECDTHAFTPIAVATHQFRKNMYEQMWRNKTRKLEFSTSEFGLKWNIFSRRQKWGEIIEFAVRIIVAWTLHSNDAPDFTTFSLARSLEYLLSKLADKINDELSI